MPLFPLNRQLTLTIDFLVQHKLLEGMLIATLLIANRLIQMLDRFARRHGHAHHIKVPGSNRPGKDQSAEKR